LAARTVRDCEAPGSNPGPPTIFVFEIGDFDGRPESAEHSRITIYLRRNETEACNSVRRAAI
jgi:hypothetical protein